MLYMTTFTINILSMLAYIPYMDPMGYDDPEFFHASQLLLVSFAASYARFFDDDTTPGCVRGHRRGGPIVMGVGIFGTPLDLSSTPLVDD